MKQWFEKLNDPSRDVFERRYRLMSAVSLTTLILWIIVALIADGYSFRILFFAVCEALFIPTMILTLRTGKIQLGAGASGVVLVFFMLPFAFFFNGGIYAGAPNWAIIAMVFITLTVRGNFRKFLLISDIAVTILCYGLAWFFPQLVDTFTDTSAYVDSMSSLIITAIMTGIMFFFQMHISNQERQQMEEQQKEILELNRAQNRFFSSMSHEIRTPVNTIIGLNEMILREDISEEVTEDAIQIRAASRLLLHLINDILDLSKLESGRLELACAEYSLGDLLSEVVGMMWIHAREKKLSFHVDIDPELPSGLYGDEMRIRQVLINILNNAIKYTPEGSVTLTVQGKWKDGGFSLVAAVSDTGTGIRKENLPYLFTAFKRVDSDQNRKIEGTGLGLTIVKQLLDLMGGTISVNSVYTKGSTFLVEIPQEVTDANPVGERKVGPKSSEPSFRKYEQSFEAPEARILVVDDNASNRMVVEKLLRDTRMQIDTAGSGEEALAKTESGLYHLIFMDHLMPGMDGVDCLHLLRNQAGGMSREAKVVALTANAGSESRGFYAREGFDGYLSKPCTGELLEQECIRLLPKELVQIKREESGIVEASMLWMTERERKEEVLITTDSIADLPQDLINKYRIGIIPHVIHTPEGIFKDGVEVETTGLLNYMEERNSRVRTLPPEVAEYESFFAGQLARANNVIHISISSKVTGSGFANAVEAAGAFHNVTVVDSRHLSSGQGLVVLLAAALVQEGLSTEQILRKLETAKTRIHSSFVVDSLDYMIRAELVGQRKARLLNALMIHPVLRLREGEIRVSRVHFGSRQSSWKKYIASELRSLSLLDKRILFVTCAGISAQEAEWIREEIHRHETMKHVRFERIVFQKASPAIAVNCGPGTFGLLFVERET